MIKKISPLPIKGYLYTKSNMKEKTQEKNNLTFKFYLNDFVLIIPFTLSFCLGFVKIGKNKKKSAHCPLRGICIQKAT